MLPFWDQNYVEKQHVSDRSSHKTLKNGSDVVFYAFKKWVLGGAWLASVLNGSIIPELRY